MAVVVTAEARAVATAAVDLEVVRVAAVKVADLVVGETVAGLGGAREEEKGVEARVPVGQPKP